MDNETYKEGDVIRFLDAIPDGLKTGYDYSESVSKCREYDFPIAKSLGIKYSDPFLGTVRADQTEKGEVFASYIDMHGFEGALYFNTKQIVLVKRLDKVVNDYQIY